MYFIAIINQETENVELYVDSITFENQHLKSFKNTTIKFTNNILSALVIKSHELAMNLAVVVKRATHPTLKIEVIELTGVALELWEKTWGAI